MKSNKLIAILSILILAAAACNLPSSSSSKPTQDVAQIVAQTQTAIAIESFLTATVAPQQDIPVLPSATQVNTPIPTTPVLPPNTPTLTATIQANCTDKAQFISETVPDDTVFNPGTPFVKSWVIKNAGSCTWTPDYSLALVQGEAMSSPSSVPFGQTIQPGNTIELKLSLVAPSDPGEHAGSWKLRNQHGQDFGNLWVKITVAGGGADTPAGLGAPTWVETFDASASFALGADSGIDYTLNNGNLVLTSSAQGDQWRISSKGYLDDFYLEARFKTGATCSAKDSYGLIARAPDQPDNIIDSTYVITFSCDGKYRVYRMDNGVYTGIQNWTASPNIKAGPDKANSIGIKAKGSTIQIYANGNLIFEFSDSAYSIGYFGLVIRSDVTNNFQVLVSEISYWDLSK